MKHQVSSELVIEAPDTTVWAVLANLETVQHYDDSILDAYYLGDQRSGVGAARRCDLPNSEYMCERVINWQEGSSYTIEVYDDHSTGWPCDDQVAHFVLSRHGDGQTLVSMVYEYRIKSGVSMSQQEVSSMAEALITSVLNGLKSFIEVEESAQITR